MGQATAAKHGYHDLVRYDVIDRIPMTGGTVLDVGGGVGTTSAKIRERGLVERTVVLDLVPAQHNLADASFIGDLERDSIIETAVREEGPFSMVLCLDILEHLVDPWSVVKRLHQGMAPGGILIASIPNVRCLEAMGPLLFKGQWQLKSSGILDRTHLRFFVKQTAIELITSSGLSLHSIDGIPHGERKLRWLRKVTFGLAKSFTDRQYIVIARNTVRF